MDIHRILQKGGTRIIMPIQLTIIISTTLLICVIFGITNTLIQSERNIECDGRTTIGIVSKIDVQYDLDGHPFSDIFVTYKGDDGKQHEAWLNADIKSAKKGDKYIIRYLPLKYDRILYQGRYEGGE